MLKIVWIVIILFISIADILAIVHVVRNKHQEPTSAILWIFIILVFNLLGIFLYFTLGINKFIKTKFAKIYTINKKEYIKNTRNNSGFVKYLEYAKNFIHNSYSKKSYQIMLDKLLPETNPYLGNKIELLEDGTTAYPKMLEAIENSKNHIHLQSYIIMNDSFGKILFDTLFLKAKEGVQIKILFDSIGSAKAYYSNFFSYWLKKNSNIKIHPFSNINLLAPYKIQLRNHRKLLICDGKIAFIGGINISEENVFKPKNKYIHDLHCMIYGPIIGEFQYLFLRDWALSTKTSLQKLLLNNSFFPITGKTGNAIIRPVASGPGQSDEATEKIFMIAANSAEESIWIITPYFVPDKSFIKALIIAAAKGIDIKIIIPQNNNHWYVRYASRSLYNILLENNIKIYEKKGVFSHAKAMLVDKRWAYMGSSNCDIRSFRLNYELDFIVEDINFIKGLYEQFRIELSNSEEITLEKRFNIKYFEEILEGFCSLLTPVL